MSACTKCDGSGYYLPRFAAAQGLSCLVNCDECNADFSQDLILDEEAMTDDPAPAPATTARGGAS